MITGTTEEMEYMLAGAEAWIPVTGTEITGLAAGEYHIRFAEKDGYNASPHVVVVVSEYEAPAEE